MYLIVFIKYPQIFIYDGTTGERVGSLGGEKAHKGGIYAVSVFRLKQTPVNNMDRYINSLPCLKDQS